MQPVQRRKFDLRRSAVLRWLLGREPRIIDLFLIGVITPLLVIGALAVLSSVKGHAGANQSRPGVRPLVEAGRTPVRNAAGSYKPVYIDDLPKENGSPVELGPVKIGGRTYEHGIHVDLNWIESQWEASYAIPHGAQTFSAIIGNDDEQSDNLWTSMSLLYEVLANGHLIGSGHAKGYSHDGPIDADVAGKITITLRVKVVSGLTATTADWAEPVFR